jgi:hypothetical protein
MSIEVSQRRAVFAELKPYCHCAGESDYMEVTQFSNGEGVDINISRRSGDEKFTLTWGEWELLQVLMNWKGD